MRFVTASALVLSLVACGGASDGDGDPGDFCQKADACNALNNMSVDECTGALDRVLNNALPSDAHDLKLSMAKCTQMEACKNFIPCVQALTKG